MEVPRLSGAGTPPTVAVYPVGFVPPGPCPRQTAAVSNDSCPAAAPFRARDGSCASNATVSAGKALGCSRSGPFGGAPAAPSWPFVLLPASGWLGSGGFDVAARTAQPMMVTVRTTATTSAGEWRGLVRVIDSSGVRRALDLRITVWNFTLPPASLPALFGVRGEWAARFGWSDEAYEDFLLSHRVPVASLIHGPTGWPSVNNNASRLARLRARGQRMWIIGSMNDLCEGLNQSSCASDGPGEAAVTLLLQQMKAAQKVADQAGWPRKQMYAYIGSEPKTYMMPALGRVLPLVRKAFPDVTIVSCGIAQFVCASGLNPDGSHSTMPGCPAATKEVDILLPRSIYYTNYSKHAAPTLRAMRARHQQIGWYTSGVPNGEGALNFFTQLAPLRARLLTVMRKTQPFLR